MSFIQRIKNRLLAKVASRYQPVSRALARSYEALEFEDTPWTPPAKPLCESKVAIVTTAGLHHGDQEPFDMKDPEGDPSFRIIDLRRPRDSIVITHDYYDHTDADRDINVVFPVDRLGELVAEGLTGSVSDINIGIMGHITGHHIETLMNRTAPGVARILGDEGVDAVLFTPG